MILLPNSCTCSEPSVFPKNWKTVNASIKDDWRIQYYFKDPEHEKPKLVVVKRMNRYKTVPERRAITKMLLENEIKSLQQGYNPITRKTFIQDNEYEIDPRTPFIEALRKALSKLKISDKSIINIKSSLTYIERASDRLGYSEMPISVIRRKNIIAILEACKLPPQSFNHYRAYVMQLFTKLVEMEACEVNPVKEIPKENIEENLRELITPEERKIIAKHFKDDKYFLRFLNVFFHSGGREIEMTRLKKEAINLNELFYKTKVLKRRKVVEEKRPIKKIVASFWEQILEEADEGDFIFGKDLKPGKIQCKEGYMTKKWKREVKEKLGINKDLYALKHTNLDETSAILDAEAAQKQAGHKTKVTTLKYYLVNEEERERERLSNVANKFA